MSTYQKNVSTLYLFLERKDQRVKDTARYLVANPGTYLGAEHGLAVASSYGDVTSAVEVGNAARVEPQLAVLDVLLA